jgi:hypothetical protein
VKWRVWPLAGQGRTVETMVDEFAKHLAGIGAKYADRLFKEVERSFDKWRTHSAYHASIRLSLIATLFRVALE